MIYYPVFLLIQDNLIEASTASLPIHIKDEYDASGTKEAEKANKENELATGLVSKIKGEAPNQVAEVTVKNLKPGIYYLVETEAPEGYLLIAPIKLEVTVITTVKEGETVDTVCVTAEQENHTLAGALTKPWLFSNLWLTNKRLFCIIMLVPKDRR